MLTLWDKGKWYKGVHLVCLPVAVRKDPDGHWHWHWNIRMASSYGKCGWALISGVCYSFLLLAIVIIYLYVWCEGGMGHMYCHTVCVRDVRGQLCGISPFLLPLHGFQDSNSGHQAWSAISRFFVSMNEESNVFSHSQKLSVLSWTGIQTKESQSPTVWQGSVLVLSCVTLVGFDAHVQRSPHSMLRLKKLCNIPR